MRKTRIILALLMGPLLCVAAEVPKVDAVKAPDLSLDNLLDPTVQITPPVPPKKYSLQAIARNNLTSFCVINNSILAKGDQIDKFKVAEIAHDHVLLIDDANKPLKLKLF